MSIRAKRAAVFGLVLCVILSMLCLSPVKARAEGEIGKVLATTSYTPVALMEVQFITAATSTEGCYVSSITWYDKNYAVETSFFSTDTYHLEIRLDAYEGYVFAENLSAYLNNSSVDYARDESGTFITLKRDYTPDVWQPTVIKHPGGETVDAGGWASFVATATYTSDYKWSLMDPSGRSLACSELNTKFPASSVDGDGTGKIIIYNIPPEMDGWKAVCTFSGPGGSVSSNGALITVRPDPAAATPEPSPEPTSEPEPEPSPEETDSPEAHEHRFSESWAFDESSHWRECECGETADKAEHSFKWTETLAATKKQPGEEEGVCSVCGYRATREIEFEKDTNATGGVSFKTFKTILFGLLGLLIIGLLALVIRTIEEGKRRRRHKKHK